jgi:hypothetical protein
MRGRLTVLGLWLAAKVTTALMPPHPDYTSWESVHAMRRRLNVTFGYEPVHVSHEHCRYLSEDQCRKDDEGLGHAKAGGGVNGRRLGPSIGDNVRVLVLLVRFSDHATRTLPQRDYFETLFNSDGVSDMNTVGSIKEYLRYSSMGKYRVQFDVRDWLTLANTEAYYSSGTSGVVGSSNIQEMFTEALNAVQAAGVDWYNGYISDWYD